MFARRMLHLLGVTLLLLSAAGAPALAASTKSSKGVKEPKVTVDIREASVADALRMVLRNTSDSLTIAPSALAQQRISLKLNAVELSRAMQMACTAAGLTCQRSKDGIWLVSAPQQAVITIGNQQVPVIGAMVGNRASNQGVNVVRNQTVSQGPTAAAPGEIPTEVTEVMEFPQIQSRVYRLPSGDLRLVTDSQVAGSNAALEGPPITAPGPEAVAAAGAARERRHVGQFPSGANADLVTLEVTDLPLREAMAKLCQTSGVDVVAYGDLPPAIRMTAHAYLVPLGAFLENVSEQSGLAVQYEHLNAVGKPIPRDAHLLGQQVTGPFPYHYRYYLVPLPKVSLTDRGKTVPTGGWGSPFSEEFIGPLVDLEATNLPLREALAKLVPAGQDVIVHKAVPETIHITAKLYRVPLDWLGQVLTTDTGLELKTQHVTAEGAVVPGPEDQLRHLTPPSEVHTRYYIVPKSELKVTGVPRTGPAPKATARNVPRPTSPASKTMVVPAPNAEDLLRQFQRPSGPVQLDPHSGVVGLLRSTPDTPAVVVAK